VINFTPSAILHHRPHEMAGFETVRTNEKYERQQLLSAALSAWRVSYYFYSLELSRQERES
jgi:hypothetical protein